VLLVDEVLAVGDEAFAHRCIRRIEEFLASGRTLLFVSHSLDLVEGICDRVMWLEGGRPRGGGGPRRGVEGPPPRGGGRGGGGAQVGEGEGEEHRAAKERREEREERAPKSEKPETESKAAETPEAVLRWGSGEAEITAIRLLGPDGREHYHLASGEDATFE